MAPITLKMVADACGISVGAASKAIHYKRGISAEKAKQVREKAEQMGYQPNAAATTLVSTRSKLIGIMHQEGMGHEFFSQILDSIRKEAERLGYTVIFIPHWDRENMSYLDYALQRQCDGVIVGQGDFDSGQMSQLLNSGIPLTSIDYIYPQCNAVLSDNELALEKSVDYIYALGYRNLAVITGPKSDIVDTRMRGFNRSCQKHGLQVPEEFRLQADFHNPEACRKAVKKLLKNKNRPDCILFPDDISALGGIQALKEEGIRVPEEMGCFGFDGIPMTRYMYPVLSTYRQDTETIGKEAVLLLKASIEGDRKPRTVKVPGSVQTGQTLSRQEKRILDFYQ